MRYRGNKLTSAVHAMLPTSKAPMATKAISLPEGVCFKNRTERLLRVKTSRLGWLTAWGFTVQQLDQTVVRARGREGVAHRCNTAPERPSPYPRRSHRWANGSDDNPKVRGGRWQGIHHQTGDTTDGKDRGPARLESRTRHP